MSYHKSFLLTFYCTKKKLISLNENKSQTGTFDFKQSTSGDRFGFVKWRFGTRTCLTELLQRAADIRRISMSYNLSDYLVRLAVSYRIVCILQKSKIKQQSIVPDKIVPNYRCSIRRIFNKNANEESSSGTARSANNLTNYEIKIYLSMSVLLREQSRSHLNSLKTTTLKHCYMSNLF